MRGNRADSQPKELIAELQAQALRAYRNNEWEQAVGLWQQVVRMDETGISKTAIVQLSTCYQRLGLVEEGAVTIDRILEVLPKNPYALAERANLAFLQGEVRAAAQAWRRAISAYKSAGAPFRAKQAYLAAEAFVKSGRKMAARHLLKSFAAPKEHSDTFLAFANLNRHRSRAWLDYLNRYLRQKGMKEVRLQEQPRVPKDYFFLLAGSKAQMVQSPIKIIVIMPALNAQPTIETAIRSILAQSWRNLELIVVDDGSSDDTGEIAARMAKRDERLRLIRNPLNVGAFVSRNIGLSQASGWLVTCMDSDDWAHPDRLRTQAEALLAAPNQIANMCCHVRMTRDAEFELFWWGSYTSNRAIVSLMFRRERVMQSAGFWDSARARADGEYVDRLARLFGEERIGTIPETGLIALRLDTGTTGAGLKGKNRGYIPPEVRAYHKGFAQWHQSLERGEARMPFPSSKRKFPIPEELVVPTADIQRALRAAQQGE